MPISRRIVFLRDFAEEAEKLRASWGKTDLFSTGLNRLDKYLGGGYGRNNGYEIVVLFGPTGVGKSLVGLNLLRQPLIDGQRIGLMALEDDGPDVFLRFTDIIGKAATREFIMQGDNVHSMPPEDLLQSWVLDDLLKLIEEWFTTRELDVILLDHLQFAFEGAETIKGENEYAAQRVFMQKLNQLMKKLKKTIIIVNHVNKDARSKGMNKIVGSGSIAQAGTKVIEIYKEDGDTLLHLWKSRFTPTPEYPCILKLNGTRLEDKNVLQPAF